MSVESHAGHRVGFGTTKRSQAACRPPYSPVSNLTTTDNLVLKVFGKGQKERLVPFSPELRRRVIEPSVRID